MIGQLFLLALVVACSPQAAAGKLRAKEASWLGTVVADGNSLTWGAAASDPAVTSYPAVLKRLSGWDVWNRGARDETTEGMTATAPERVDPLRPALVIAWEGINSCLDRRDSPAEAYLSLTAYIRARRAAGARVVVLTVLPSPQLAAFAPAYNSRVTGNAAGADFVVDLGLDLRLIDPADHRYFFTDQVHLIDAGYQAVAEDVFAVVGKIALVK